MALQETPNLPRIVIIGGGFGGLQVARKLRKTACEVFLIDRHNYHTFQPLLYQVATGGLEPDSIAFPLRKIFINQKNLIFRVAEVEQIDTAQKTLQTSIGPITYDYLVIATGSTTNFFGNKSIEHFSMPMKSIPEAINLRSLILQNMEDALLDINKARRDAFMTFVIVGGGPTGVEMAGALSELRNDVLPKDYPELDLTRMKIYLIESSDILASMSEKSTEDAKRDLLKMGVEIMLHKRVTSYDGDVVHIDDGTVLEAENVIWSAGVMGDLMPGLPAESIGKGSRINVDNYNRVKGTENIFAIGDIASMLTDKFPHGIPGLAPAAMQQGKHLGKNLTHILKKEDMEPFVYFDKGSMATIGRNQAVVDLRKLHLNGIFAWYTWMFVHLLFLVGFRNRIIVLFNWIYNYFSYDRGTRVIIRRFDRKKMVEEPVILKPEPPATAETVKSVIDKAGESVAASL